MILQVVNHEMPNDVVSLFKGEIPVHHHGLVGLNMVNNQSYILLYKFAETNPMGQASASNY